MAREIEIKFRVGDPEALRARLTAAGAAPRSVSFEINHILDTAQRELLGRGCGLRVRESRPLESLGGGRGDPQQARAVLTFKGPREPGRIKVREELETPVGSAAGALAILGALGYREVIRYEKRRELWRLGECDVTIDAMPGLGLFGEIEGPSPAVLEQVRERLRVAESDLVPESYVSIAAKHGKIAPGGARRLLFDSADRAEAAEPGEGGDV